MCVLIATTGSAIADDYVPAPPPAQDDTPWGKGVSLERRTAAQKLLEAGNDLFVQNKHREALAKYQEAVADWDHPSIRFNMVRALIALDHPLEAYQSLEKALAYGKGPLEAHVYDEALNYKRLLDGMIATLEISCKQAGVKISVDGAEFLACPGSKSVRTTPGSHAIVGLRTGFLTKTLGTQLVPGTKRPIEISLISLDAATTTRWAPWKPWVVAASGAAVAGMGSLLEIAASHRLNAYDAGVKMQCNTPTGCTPEQLGSLGDERSRGRLETSIAVPSMVVGGAALIGGIALVILNRPHTMQEQRVKMSPSFGIDSAGIVIAGQF